MALLYGRAGCLTAKNGGFRPGQMRSRRRGTISRGCARCSPRSMPSAWCCVRRCFPGLIHDPGLLTSTPSPYNRCGILAFGGSLELRETSPAGRGLQARRPRPGGQDAGGAPGLPWDVTACHSQPFLQKIYHSTLTASGVRGNRWRRPSTRRVRSWTASCARRTSGAARSWRRDWRCS